MLNIDKRLKSIFIGGLLWLFVLSYIVLFLHFQAEHKQAQRELEYRMAHQRVAAQRQQRQMAWEKQLQEQRLRRQYNQGRVLGSGGQPVR